MFIDDHRVTRRVKRVSKTEEGNVTDSQNKIANLNDKIKQLEYELRQTQQQNKQLEDRLHNSEIGHRG